ncbi:MAG: hypothetical protein JJU10_05420 [Idiomarina sp.]|nr:hypothetical protein [Idiomarina sp.]
MIQFQGTYVDRHGITHTDPVFCIRQVSFNKSQSKESTLNVGSHDYEQSESSHCTVNYNVCYWTNAQAKDDGKEPLIFSHEGNDWLYFSEAVVDENTNLIELCEQHFQVHHLQQS